MQLVTSEILLYILIGLAAFSIILLIWVVRLELKTRRLMRGKGGLSLEDSFLSMDSDIKNLHKFRTDLEEYLKNVEKRLGRSIQGVENINFNAFTGSESGGKSFAVAFINEKGDGVIISSMHSRDRVNIFSKQVKNFKAEMELSEEEALALTNAKNSCKV